MSLQAEINPRLNNSLRELAGGSISMLPSSIKIFRTLQPLPTSNVTSHRPGSAPRNASPS